LTVRGIVIGQAGVAAMLPPAYSKVQPSTRGSAPAEPKTEGGAPEQASADRKRI
jgi:hypothetical protein